MFTRICQSSAVVAVCLLALLGIMFLPAMLMVWAAAAALLGGIVSTWCHLLAPEAGAAVRLGVVTAALMMALGLAVAGSIVLLGVAAVWVVPLLLGLGGLPAWRHRQAWVAALTAFVEAKPAAATPTSSPQTERVRSTDTPHDGHTEESTPPAPPAQLPALEPSAMSTIALCGAWQRSYWLLLELPPGPSRDELVRIRRHVLDELERRDPTGFGRWLDSEPRAGSHPGQYLIADR